MKKLIKIIAAAFITCSIASQAFGQKFGIKAGLNLSNQVSKDDDRTYSDDNKMNVGFHVGPTVEFSLNDLFSVETGLLLSTKGFRIHSVDNIFGNTLEYTGKRNLLYLDLPVTAKIGFEVGSAKIYVAAGPYVGVGLSGKTSGETIFMGETKTESKSINWGTDNDDHYKRFDFGLTGGAGVEIGAIQISASYGLGLINISPYSNNGYKVSNRVIGISVAYRFGGDK